ncbi:hypothetical protein [Pluralibacter gergoviae]|uniref:hypothetical protein n=1 Tax=Pluralibacter gergoviae TaxID=61647 RepID=UPI000AE2E9F3|nr:hypothetical protein [Pluralibacter gergoviae]
MARNGVRSTYSQSPMQIIMCDKQGVISTGTAFHYYHNSDVFLITNWHNISGRHFLTKEPLSAQNRFPESIKIKYISYIDQYRDNFTSQAFELKLYDESCIPVWFEHEVYKSDCDVVAIPIPIEVKGFIADNMHYPVNSIGKNQIPILPGNNVSIIGFPSSLSVGFGLPIWKSGYIASEPFYPINLGGSLSDIGGLKGGKNLPAFFIDSQTRTGMSGSPIFCTYRDIYSLSDPYEDIDVNDPNFMSRDDILFTGSVTQFIGCYSGRVGKKEDGAGLGLCWGEDVVKDICRSRRKGLNPHVSCSQ